MARRSSSPPADSFDVPSQAFSDVAFLAGATQARIPIELFNGVLEARAGREDGRKRVRARGAPGHRRGRRARGQLLRVLDMPGFDDVEGVPVDGVLGVELFKRLVVQIDYARRELLLADSPSVVGFGDARR